MAYKLSFSNLEHYQNDIEKEKWFEDIKRELAKELNLSPGSTSFSRDPNRGSSAKLGMLVVFDDEKVCREAERAWKDKLSLKTLSAKITHYGKCSLTVEFDVAALGKVRRQLSSGDILNLVINKLQAEVAGSAPKIQIDPDKVAYIRDTAKVYFGFDSKKHMEDAYDAIITADFITDFDIIVGKECDGLGHPWKQRSRDEPEVVVPSEQVPLSYRIQGDTGDNPAQAANLNEQKPRGQQKIVSLQKVSSPQRVLSPKTDASSRTTSPQNVASSQIVSPKPTSVANLSQETISPNENLSFQTSQILTKVFRDATQSQSDIAGDQQSDGKSKERSNNGQPSSSIPIDMDSRSKKSKCQSPCKPITIRQAPCQQIATSQPPCQPITLSRPLCQPITPSRPPCQPTTTCCPPCLPVDCQEAIATIPQNTRGSIAFDCNSSSEIPVNNQTMSSQNPASQASGNLQETSLPMSVPASPYRPSCDTPETSLCGNMAYQSAPIVSVPMNKRECYGMNEFLPTDENVMYLETVSPEFLEGSNAAHDQISRFLSGLSNAGGGMLMIGVTNNRQVIGIALEKESEESNFRAGIDSEIMKMYPALSLEQWNVRFVRLTRPNNDRVVVEVRIAACAEVQASITGEVWKLNNWLWPLEIFKESRQKVGSAFKLRKHVLETDRRALMHAATQLSEVVKSHREFLGARSEENASYREHLLEKEAEREEKLERITEIRTNHELLRQQWQDPKTNVSEQCLQQCEERGREGLQHTLNTLRDALDQYGWLQLKRSEEERRRETHVRRALECYHRSSVYRDLQEHSSFHECCHGNSTHRDFLDCSTSRVDKTPFTYGSRLNMSGDDSPCPDDLGCLGLRRT